MESRLEVVRVDASDVSGESRTPILFVHGAYAGAWLWQDHYLPFFAERGWPAWAVSLSGHGRSKGHGTLDAFSLADYVRDVREVVAQMPAPPVLVGHSMGGMVVQKFLEGGIVAGAVLLASVPPQGLMNASLALLFQKPLLMIELNKVMSGGTPDLERLQQALFHRPVSRQRLLDIFSRCQPESIRALWDMTMFDLPRPARMHRPPMLVIGAAEDQLIPVVDVHRTAETYHVPAHIFPDMGHGMMLEENWRGPAELIASWLLEQGL